jgi:DNA polymerase I-like protein with 3'-5' exonuclease and polymerase domains
VGVDASGLELRMLGHYLAPLDGGAYAREVVEGDVHTRMMKACRFLQSDNFKAARDGMKRGIYGLIYGAGNWKLGQIYAQTLLDQGLPAIPTSQYAKEGRRIRNAIEENIVGYKELTKQVKAKAKLAGKLTGLDGRTLWVRGLHSALNLLVQSAGIIAVKEAMMIAPHILAAAGLEEDKHYWPVMWVHDEWQVEALPECAEEVGRLLATTFTIAGESLGVRCRLDGEFKVGTDWSMTH